MAQLHTSEIPLSEREERFAVEYLVDLNKTAAAKRAGYSEKSAHTIAQRVFNKANVQAKIQHLKEERSKRTEITQDRVLQELARIAFGDIRKAVKWGVQPVMVANEDGELEAQWPLQLIPSDEIDDDTAAAVQSIALVKGGIKITMHSKLTALQSLAEHTGVFAKRDANNMNALAEAFAQIQQRGSRAPLSDPDEGAAP